MLVGSKRISTSSNLLRKISTLAAVAGCLVFCSDRQWTHAAEHAPAAAIDGGDDAAGAKSYSANCAICHGEHREGNLPAFPPLLGVEHQLNDAQITEIVKIGRGRMPGIPGLEGDELANLLRFLHSKEEPSAKQSAGGTTIEPGSAAAEQGRGLFQQNCAFCHGRDAMGGETGPDLTRSMLVLSDVNGDKISQVVREGRPEKKMPAFNFAAPELQGLAAFIHGQVTAAAAQKGGRRGVDVADLQTGNADAGKRYFEGAGGCTKCHSAAGDLAGVASRFEGLALEMRMLYPEHAKSKVRVTVSSGQKFEGQLEYLDEFTVGLRDKEGNYHSWPTSRVTYKVDAPVEAHVDQFGKYTDADIHNLMAYVQTLK